MNVMVQLFNHYNFLVDNPLFWLYVSCLTVDLITGNVRAWTTDEVDSSAGVMGSLKHFGLFAFIIIFLPTLSMYLGDSTVSHGLILYFVYQYIISIVENLGLLGFPIPPDLAKKFTRLNGEDGEKK